METITLTAVTGTAMAHGLPFAFANVRCGGECEDARRDGSGREHQNNEPCPG